MKIIVQYVFDVKNATCRDLREETKVFKMQEQFNEIDLELDGIPKDNSVHELLKNVIKRKSLGEDLMNHNETGFFKIFDYRK